MNIREPAWNGRVVQECGVFSIVTVSKASKTALFEKECVRQHGNKTRKASQVPRPCTVKFEIC